MSAKVVYNVTAKTGEYNDRQTGERKFSYMTCGKVFRHDDGRFTMKLEAIPINFDGWFNLMTPKPKGDGRSGGQGGEPRQQQQRQAPQQEFDDFNDEIPF